MTTTAAGDVIYGYCVADATCNAGQGFTVRSTLNNNLIEDKTTGNPGVYTATGSANNGWTTGEALGNVVYENRGQIERGQSAEIDFRSGGVVVRP